MLPLKNAQALKWLPRWAQGPPSSPAGSPSREVHSCQKYFCILLRDCLQASPFSPQVCLLPLGPLHPGPSRDLPLCLRVTFISNTGLRLADVLLGFVLIVFLKKNNSYLLTVLIIIFQMASNCDYFSCCLSWQGQLSWISFLALLIVAWIG